MNVFMTHLNVVYLWMYAGLYTLFLSKGHLFSSWCRRSSWVPLSTFQVTSINHYDIIKHLQTRNDGIKSLNLNTLLKLVNLTATYCNSQPCPHPFWTSLYPPSPCYYKCISYLLLMTEVFK